MWIKLPVSTRTGSRRQLSCRCAGNGSKHGKFLGVPLLSRRVARGHHLVEKATVVAAAVEVAAAAQHQGLVDGCLEAVMALLDVAVLVGLAGWMACGVRP